MPTPALSSPTAPGDLDDPLVLALPRGGVPVARVVADRLGAPLDVLVARKIGAPSQPELGIGAIAEGGATVPPPTTCARCGSAEDEFQQIIEREQRSCSGASSVPRLVARCPRGRPRLVLVDDGLATGSPPRRRSARCAPDPSAPSLAVPVGRPETVRRLVPPADEVVCVVATRHLVAVGAWYHDFTQTTDDEVLAP